MRFLVKQEKNGDLRKDARIMEFNAVINRVFQDDPEARRRNLRLRTYSVVCLNEECGLLEWVNHTSHLRSLIQQSHLSKGSPTPFLLNKDVFESLKRAQEEYALTNLDALSSMFQQCALDKYKPYFHRWFIDQFHDPTQWLDARTAFTRSTAVWSAVGHIVGLGDRHTENILLDVTNG